MESAACFYCQDPDTREILELQMLCEILQILENATS